jgi:putative salt-induced outer membrane protein YdiY
LDVDDIQHIRSAQLIQVAFIDGYIHSGKLFVDGDSVMIMGEEDYESTRGQVLSLTAGAPRERNFWRGKIGAGLNVRTGNTEQTEFNANLNFIRRTPINRINIDYLGNFSENDGSTIADNQRANVGWNRFLTRRFYLTPAYGEYFRDPFQNIRQRYTVGVGAGYQMVDTSRIDWSLDAGLGYQRTNFDSVQEGDEQSANTPALSLGTNYDNEITKWMDYFFQYSIQIVNKESGTFNHHLKTGFEFEFFKDFDFDVSLVWDRIQDPQQNADGSFPQQDDFRTIFGLGYNF